MRAKILVGLLMASMMASPACAQSNMAASAPFQEVLERIVRDDPTSPGAIIAVSSPTLGIEWQGAVGKVERGKADPLRPTDAFRVASVTKVFTSATTMRLIEEGKFGLYDSIAPLISRRTADELRRGGYQPEKITVQQLLSHTSGIFDYAMSEAFLAAILGSPARNWTRDEQITFAIDHGRKLSEPGKEFHYSDTGYIILGEIVERSSGMSLPAAAAHFLDYKRLGLTHTYFEKLEKTPAGERRTHHYMGDKDLSDNDPSMDLYGGGGIVSTAGDLVHFIRPLLLGEVFTKRSTLAAALLTPPVPTTGGATHAPLLTTDKIGNRRCWAHGGFWGVTLVYCPDVDMAIAVAWGQVDDGKGQPGKAVGFSGVADALGEAVNKAVAIVQKQQQK